MITNSIIAGQYLPIGYDTIRPGLEKAISGSYVGLDTSFLMLCETPNEGDTPEQAEAVIRDSMARQDAVFMTIWQLCGEYNRTIWVMQSVVEELQHLRDSGSQEYRANMADKALRFLHDMQEFKIVTVYPDYVPGMKADFNILMRVEELRATERQPIMLLSQDRQLMADALVKNEIHSVVGSTVAAMFFDNVFDFREFGQEDRERNESRRRGRIAAANAAPMNDWTEERIARKREADLAKYFSIIPVRPLGTRGVSPVGHNPREIGAAG